MSAYTNASGNPVSDSVRIMVSNKQFKDGAVATGAITVYNGTEVIIDMEFEKKEMQWINCYANTPGYEVAIEKVEFSII